MAKGAKTGGRKAGTPNKVTADVKALAGKYTARAIEMLWSIALKGETDAARVSALKEILDRGHGKPSQAITGPDGESLLTGVQITLVKADAGKP